MNLVEIARQVIIVRRLLEKNTETADLCAANEPLRKKKEKN